jgi:exoribonuclease R
MPHVVLRAPEIFEQAFARIRQELDVPTGFPSAVLEQAEHATVDIDDRHDARHIPFVAIDPPGATDLDQTFAAEPLGSGYRVRYAIADVGAFITPGSALDDEARTRGLTLYSPDSRAPLHPPVISEDRASLLPGADKPALLWTIDLDEAGAVVDTDLRRAVVRTREAISYAAAQHRIDTLSGGPSGPTTDHLDGIDRSLSLLATIGVLRQHQEANRGGVSLNLPAQEVVRRDGHYELEFDESLPVEGWNAQISLLTGMVAGQAMFEANLGVLRTLPPASEHDVEQLRRMAEVLRLNWPDDQDYATFVRGLAPTSPTVNAFLLQCTRLFSGAGYLGFHGRTPSHPTHGAIASVYAHVTAPLRRLIDRFGNEIVLALHQGREAPSWAVEALDQLPSLMGRARQRESSLERALLDMAEALTLEHHVGETFNAVVVDLHREQARVQIAEPAVVAHIKADEHRLGEVIKLMLSSVDVENRRVDFEASPG